MLHADLSIELLKEEIKKALEICQIGEKTLQIQCLELHLKQMKALISYDPNPKYLLEE